MQRFVKWWLPVIVWLIVIFVGSSIGNVPRVGGKTSDTIVHRAAHVLEFAVLGVLLLRALSKDKPITKREIIITLIMIVIYGASDEFHQRHTPGRSSEGLSVLFDVAGGLIGVWVYQWSTNRRRRLNRAAAEQRTDESANQRANVAVPDQES
jgi:VanZ family protein